MDLMQSNLLNEVKAYVPYNEQEEIDKENIIKYLNEFDNIFLRDNTYAHVTASAWAVNKNRDKVLMVYHNIYDSWSWTGGHADGEKEPVKTALRELKEETGIKDAKLILNGIFGFEIACVEGHVKKGKYVSSHQHINFTYLFEVDEDEELKIKDDENSGVKWIDVSDIKNQVSEKWFYEKVYSKYINKVKELN